MKVIAVFWSYLEDEHEDTHIYGVYSTKEKSQEAINRLCENDPKVRYVDTQEWEVDPHEAYHTVEKEPEIDSCMEPGDMKQ